MNSAFEEHRSPGATENGTNTLNGKKLARRVVYIYEDQVKELGGKKGFF
jgi:hypothetical protein